MKREQDCLHDSPLKVLGGLIHMVILRYRPTLNEACTLIPCVSISALGSSQTIRFGAKHQQIAGNDLRNKTSRPQALTCWGPTGPPLIPFPYWARPSVYQGFRYFPKVLPFSSSVEPSGINP